MAVILLHSNVPLKDFELGLMWDFKVLLILFPLELDKNQNLAKIRETRPLGVTFEAEFMNDIRCSYKFHFDSDSGK